MDRTKTMYLCHHNFDCKQALILPKTPLKRVLKDLYEVQSNTSTKMIEKGDLELVNAVRLGPTLNFVQTSKGFGDSLS